MNNSIENPSMKIETIKKPNGDEVSFCPERGGIITSIKFKGREILYLDPATLQDPNVSVKGGVPVLFPNAGPLESPQFPDLKQHGFARNMRWQSQKGPENFSQTLQADADTRKVFPYDFKLSIGGQFEADGSFSMNQSVENLEKEKVMPVSMGLHPYFKVPNIEKSNIKFNFAGGKFAEEQIASWVNGKVIKACSIDNPNVPMEIVIPGMGTLVIEASPLFKKVWVWSMDGKDFICIEPVMRDKGGLVDDPEKVQPGSALHTRVNISLKE